MAKTTKTKEELIDKINTLKEESKQELLQFIIDIHQKKKIQEPKIDANADLKEKFSFINSKFLSNNINHQDKISQTFLHCAAQNPENTNVDSLYTLCCEILIDEFKANTNIKDTTGNTPCHYAASYPYCFIHFCLHNMTGLTIKNKDRQTPLDILIDNPKNLQDFLNIYTGIFEYQKEQDFIKQLLDCIKHKLSLKKSISDYRMLNLAIAQKNENFIAAITKLIDTTQLITQAIENRNGEMIAAIKAHSPEANRYIAKLLSDAITNGDAQRFTSLLELTSKEGELFLQETKPKTPSNTAELFRKLLDSHESKNTCDDQPSTSPVTEGAEAATGIDPNYK